MLFKISLFSGFIIIAMNGRIILKPIKSIEPEIIEMTITLKILIIFLFTINRSFLKLSKKNHIFVITK